MKRFLFLVFIGFIALMIFMSEYEPADQPLPKKLEQAIKQTRMMEYHDDDYDYIVRHPQFFEQTADSLMDKVPAASPSGRTASRWCSRPL